METVTTAILDKFSNLRAHKFWVVLVVAVLGYLGGLGFTTNVGFPSNSRLNKQFDEIFFAEWNVLAPIDG